LRGALLAMFAITLPPLLVLLVERAYRRVKDHPAVEGFMRGLSLAVAGVFTITLMQMIRSVGADARSLLIVLAALGLGATRRVPFSVLIVLGALAGILTRGSR